MSTGELIKYDVVFHMYHLDMSVEAIRGGDRKTCKQKQSIRPDA